MLSYKHNLINSENIPLFSYANLYFLLFYHLTLLVTLNIFDFENPIILNVIFLFNLNNCFLIFPFYNHNNFPILLNLELNSITLLFLIYQLFP